MKAILALATVLVFSAQLFAASEIIKFRLFDGDEVEGKLSLPADTANIRELVAPPKVRNRITLTNALVVKNWSVGGPSVSAGLDCVWVSVAQA